MWHPLLQWDSHALGWLLAAGSVISLTLSMRLAAIGRGLENAMAPLGVTSLTRTRSVVECRAMLDSWDEAGRAAARTQLQIDTCLIPAFSTTLAVVGLFAARWFGGSGQRLMQDAAVVLAWVAWLAGAIDFAENTTLLRILHAYPQVPERLTRLTRWFARCKYLLIYMAIAICLSAFFAVLNPA